jgi:hypothetical protein
MTIKIEDITQEIQNSPEFGEQLKQALLTPEDLTAAIEKKDAKVMPVIDRMVTQAVNGFKEKGMIAILDSKKEEWKKDYFAEFAKENNIVTDPVIKQMHTEMEELKASIAAEKREKNSSNINALVTSTLAEKKISTSFAPFITGPDTDTAKTQADKFVELFDAEVNARVNAALKKTDTAPLTSGGGGIIKNPFSKKTFNLTQQQEIYRRDPVEAKALMEQAAAEE